MHFSIVFIITYIVAAVHADLTCLGWSIISPIMGLFCHFEPQYFEAAENRTATAVEEAVQDVGDLVKFDLTHNPAVITYNFIEETEKGGIGQGGQYLKNVTNDYGNVMIGFGKETTNQLITLLEVTHWNDLSTCLIIGGAGLAVHAQKQIEKRAGRHRTTSQAKAFMASQVIMIPPSDAIAMAHDCFTEKFQRIANPIKFQTNGTNQKIGSTISDLAAFLIPVGAEEKVAAGAGDVLKGTAVDLAIPGSESTTRIVKMVGENTGEHFANEKEAQTVADHIKQKSWVQENCGICGNSPAPFINLVSKKIRRGFNNRLGRRGDNMASCCRLPSVATGADDQAATIKKAGEEVNEESDTYNPKAYKQIGEADLVQAPKLVARNIRMADDIKALSNDLDTLSTGLLSWTPELTKVMSSDELLSLLRKIFTANQEDPLYKAFRITEREPGLRMTSFSNDWIMSKNPILRPLQAWVKAAVTDARDTVASLKNMHEDNKNFFKGTVEFFYTAPSEKAITGTDPRGFHIDDGQMQFGIADVPGLIVANSASRTASRLPLAKNAFHLLKGQDWNFEALVQQKPQGPTWHSVFGPEIAKEGRVSIVMSVYRPKKWRLRDSSFEAWE